MSNTHTGSDLLIREVADVLVRRRFAKIRHGVRAGAHAIVGASAAVTRDIAESAMVGEDSSEVPSDTTVWRKRETF